MRQAILTIIGIALGATTMAIFGWTGFSVLLAVFLLLYIWLLFSI